VKLSTWLFYRPLLLVASQGGTRQLSWTSIVHIPTKTHIFARKKKFSNNIADLTLLELLKMSIKIKTLKKPIVTAT
jgi:hypothetical protein